LHEVFVQKGGEGRVWVIQPLNEEMNDVGVVFRQGYALSGSFFEARG